MHRRTLSPVRRVTHETGAASAEYAAVTACGVGLGGVLLKLLTSEWGHAQDALRLLPRHARDRLTVGAEVVAGTSAEAVARAAAGGRAALLRSLEGAAAASALDGRPAQEEGRRRHAGHRSVSPGGGRGQSGAVTAEAAVVVPVLLALVLGSTWFVALAATKVRVVDAAREVARVAARGEADPAAVASGRRVAPAGTRFTVTRAGDQVVVTATVAVDGPGGLFGVLPAVTVASEAVAAAEPR